MDMQQLTQTENKPRLKRDLTREAIDMALKGDWERASQINRALVELFPDDVEALNRLGKALMELGQYAEARPCLERVAQLAPHNTIAKKNLARLDQLKGAKPAGGCKQGRRVAGLTQLFIEESGKSGITVLLRPGADAVLARVAPGDPVTLVAEKNVLKAYVGDNEYLGQVEPKLAARLMRLLNGGNRYEAAARGVQGKEVSIIIRETYQHPDLHGVCSFPSKSKAEDRAGMDPKVMRYLDEDAELDEDEDEEAVIDEDAIETDEEWN